MNKRIFLATLVAVGGIAVSTGASLALYKKLGNQTMKITTETVSKNGDLNYTLGDATKVDDATDFATALNPEHNEHKMKFNLGAYRGSDATVVEQPYTLGQAIVTITFSSKDFKDLCTVSATATGYTGTYYGTDAHKGELVMSEDTSAKTDTKIVLKQWYTINTQHTSTDPTVQALEIDLDFEGLTDSNMVSMAQASYTVNVKWQDQKSSTDFYGRPYIVGTKGWDANREFAMYQNIGQTDRYEWMYKGYSDSNENPEAKVRKTNNSTPSEDTWYPSSGNISLTKDVSYDVYLNSTGESTPRFYETFTVSLGTGVAEPAKGFYIYGFGSGADKLADWPGIKMNKQTNGTYTYQANIAERAKYQNIIFNNGESADADKIQTEDIVVNGYRHFEITGIDTTTSPKKYTYSAS